MSGVYEYHTMDIVAFALVPPLWGIVVSYAAPVEQLMLAALPLFTPHCTAKIGDDAVCKAAAECGEPAVLEWAYTQPARFPWDWSAARAAAVRFNRVDAIHWMHRHIDISVAGGQLCGSLLLTLAASHGHMSMITCLRGHGCAWSTDVANAAAGHSLETLQAVVAGGCKWVIADVFRFATKSDNPQTVAHLIKENPYDFNAFYNAMGEIKSIPMLDVFIAHPNIPKHIEVLCNIFAMQGRIEMLAAARERKVSWAVTTCRAAITFEQWSTLMWLRDNGCPWDDTLRSRVQNCQDPAVIAWMATGGDAP